MRWLQSALFNFCMVLFTALFATFVLLARPFGIRAAWWFARGWSHTMLGCLRLLCGIRLEIEGSELIPADQTCVLLAKHQSALETIAMPLLVPQFVWVLKRELFYIPIFGWALWAINGIAIQRKNRRDAMRQVLEQGKKFLEAGRWVAIFPEGTRIAAGKAGQYKAGGLRLARHAKHPVLLMAHNAGCFWPRRGFVKQPGVAKVRFLRLISVEELVANKDAVLMPQIEQEIEAATRQLEHEAGFVPE